MSLKWEIPLSVQGYESALYGPYIKDLKDDIQQDLLHVLFSKANVCTQRKVSFYWNSLIATH